MRKQTIVHQKKPEALAAADYSGPITFESFSSVVVIPTMSNALCIWRDL